MPGASCGEGDDEIARRQGHAGADSSGGTKSYVGLLQLGVRSMRFEIMCGDDDGGRVLVLSRRDERVECAGWAASSECETNAAYMLTSCAFSCTKCSEGKPHELRSKAERKSIWYKKRHPGAGNRGKNPDAVAPSPEPEQEYELEASPAPNPFVEKLAADPKYKMTGVGFEVHIIVSSSNREISTLLEQLSSATCNSQERQELFIHIDRCGNKAVYNAAHDYKWPCGPTTVTNKPVKRGMREMWFDTWELVQERHEKNGEVCRRPSAPGPCARTRIAGSHRCVSSAVADRRACPRGRYVDLASLRHVPRAGDGHGEQHVFCRWCLALANPHGRDGHASEALGGI